MNDENGMASSVSGGGEGDAGGGECLGPCDAKQEGSQQAVTWMGWGDGGAVDSPVPAYASSVCLTR